MIEITDEMVEAVRDVMHDIGRFDPLKDWECGLVIAAVAPLIAAQEREKCARRAAMCAITWSGEYQETGSDDALARAEAAEHIHIEIVARDDERQG